MRRRHTVKFIVGLGFFLWISGIGAAEFSLGLKGGGTTYFGDIDQQQLAPVSALGMDIWITRKFGVEGLGFFGQVKAEKDPDYFQSDLFGVAALLKIRPFEKAVFSPYLVGGGEYLKMNPADREGDPLPNNTAGMYKLDRLAVPVGGGFSIFPGEAVSFDVDVLYHFTFTDYLDDLPRGESEDRFLSATVGITLHFGKSKDTDGDGITDKNDADPLHPEDFDGYRDLDGAPDPDNDGDGIPDLTDKAPMQPEDKDGFEDEDGVPDPDNDGDGIPDTQDKAPNEKEDVDGFQDQDGAPDPDNDGDNIPDVKDECPGTDQTVAEGKDTRETYNGYEDTDGCPDVKPEIAVEKGAAIVLEGVYFATGSANLTQNSMVILDKVVRTMRENTGIEVEIRGHTDNTGSYQVNMRLSKERADAVKLYLINHGIDAARIRTRGYGPDSPIAPNSTREGRAKNRRIEFYRIK